MSDNPLKRLIQKITGQDAEAAAMRESLEEVIEESERESPALSAQERVMLGNLLEFGELSALGGKPSNEQREVPANVGDAVVVVIAVDPTLPGRAEVGGQQVEVG